MRLVNRGNNMEARTVARRDKFFERCRGCNWNRRNRVVDEAGSRCPDVGNIWWNSVGGCIPVSIGAQNPGREQRGNPTW